MSGPDSSSVSRSSDVAVGIVVFTILQPITSFFVLGCTPTARIYDRSLLCFLRSRLGRVASLPL